MRNKVAKQIRDIIQPENEVGRRTYRRAKKKYSSLSAAAKPVFVQALASLFAKGSESGS